VVFSAQSQYSLSASCAGHGAVPSAAGRQAALAPTVAPAAATALDELGGLGVQVAVVTNKFESFARKLLAELGLIDRFATLIGGDTLGPGRAKPAADPVLEMIARLGSGRAAFVGDSIYDTQAARNAQVPSVAVSFGFHDRPVEDLGADAVIDSYNELVPVLRTLCAT
jgi:phosphoglycolate phosphatase